MYIYITRYCSNSVIISLQRIRQRETFLSSQEITSQRHTEEQDQGGTQWEKKGTKQKSKKEKKGWGALTQTQEYRTPTNKKMTRDAAYCRRRTLNFSQLLKVANKQETLNPWVLCLCVSVSVHVCLSVYLCGAVVASICATCFIYFTKSPLVFGI